MIIIAAMSENRVIGSGSGMPWNVPEEYQQYLDFVRGQSVVMGRTTYEIFGDDLPSDTTPFVISRNLSFAVKDGFVFDSFHAATGAAQESNRTVFVAGGQSIYQLAIPVANQMYLSTIKGQFSGDRYFPEFADSEWEITEESLHDAYTFRKLRRV